jgi:hypothetical protein
MNISGVAIAGTFQGSGAGLTAVPWAGIVGAPSFLTAVTTSPRLSGNGTAGNPLDIAQQGAANGDVLKWNGSAWAPAAGGSTYSAGTGLNLVGSVFSFDTAFGDARYALSSHTHSAANIVSGTLNDARLSSNVTLLSAVQTFSGTKTFSATPSFTAFTPFTVTSTTMVTNLNADRLDGLDATAFPRLSSNNPWSGINYFTNAANEFTGIGTNLTQLHAAHIDFGTLSDDRLSTNVSRLDWDQTYTGTKTFSAAPNFTAVGPPFTVTTPAHVPNLNADRLDGIDSTGFMTFVSVTTRIIGDGTPANPLDLASQNANTGQVLKWDGSHWSPGDDAGSSYSAGTGLSLTGSTFAFDTVFGDARYAPLTHTHSAGDIISGTLLDARLSSNVAFLDTAQIFTAQKSFSAAPLFTAAGAPFNVTSSSLVLNLNADMLDGIDSSSFLTAIPNPLALTGTTTAATISGANSSTAAGASGVFGDATGTTGITYGVFGRAASVNGYGVYGLATATGAADTPYGVYGSADPATLGFGLYALGDSGASGLKSFRIDHPFDPANKYLLHYSSESPFPQNFYNGNAVTDSRGYAWVELPDYFAEINANFKYQLTIVDDNESPEFVMAKIGRKIRGNRFLIMTNAPNVEVSWQITADRNDNRVRYNRPSDVREKTGREKGRLQNPEYFGGVARRTK